MKRIEIEEKNKRIWTIENSEEEKFLHKKTEDFVFSDYEKKDVAILIKHMRTMMIKARGVGLSANQIGFPFRIFVAQLPEKNGNGYSGKFYAVINPQIISSSSKKNSDQEGCLSVPNMYGTTERSDSIVLNGVDKNGRNLTVKASGFLARIFQHECDHLNGVLFTSKAKDIQKIEDGISSGL